MTPVKDTVICRTMCSTYHGIPTLNTSQITFWLSWSRLGPDLGQSPPSPPQGRPQAGPAQCWAGLDVSMFVCGENSPCHYQAKAIINGLFFMLLYPLSTILHHYVPSHHHHHLISGAAVQATGDRLQVEVVGLTVFQSVWWSPQSVINHSYHGLRS